MENIDNLDISPFKYVHDPQSIKHTLQNRLPRSANVYSMALLSCRFKLPVEMAFFTLDVDSCSENCWIIAADYREDQGVRYNISAPQNAAVTEEVKNAFSESKLINWRGKCNFSAIDRNISRFLWDIIVCEKGNVATILPTFLYYMDIKSAKEINLENTMEKLSCAGYELKGLNPESGTTFISKTWKYSQEKSEIAIRKILEKNDSAGIYTNDGEIVCGVNVNGSGLIGMLHTLPEFRNKGFATLVMKFLMKKLAMDGIVPCSAIDMNNIKSKIFHENIDMEFSHVADFIRSTPD